MVQVDLDVLKQRWYDLGINNSPVENDNRTLFTQLDAWQRKELSDAYANGSRDNLTRWKA